MLMFTFMNGSFVILLDLGTQEKLVLDLTIAWSKCEGEIYEKLALFWYDHFLKKAYL